jgi:hypothetical protein
VKRRGSSGSAEPGRRRGRTVTNNFCGPQNPPSLATLGSSSGSGGGSGGGSGVGVPADTEADFFGGTKYLAASLSHASVAAVVAGLACQPIPASKPVIVVTFSWSGGGRAGAWVFIWSRSLLRLVACQSMAVAATFAAAAATAMAAGKQQQQQQQHLQPAAPPQASGTWGGGSFIRPGRSVVLMDLVQAADGAPQDGPSLVEAARRGIQSSQEMDMQRAYEQLCMLRRAHDQLKVHGDALQHRHGEVMRELEVLKLEMRETESQVDEGPLKQQLADEERRVLQGMIGRERCLFMMRRLRESVLEVKRGSQLISTNIRGLERELAGCEAQHQQSRQELRTEEERLKNLSAELMRRREERQKSIALIGRLVEERGLQVERSMEGLRRRDLLLAIQNGEVKSEEHERLTRMCVVRSVYSSVLQRKLEHNQTWLGSMEESFQEIKSATGLANVHDIISRFRSKSVKNQQLHQMAEELRQRIEQLRKDITVQRHSLNEQRNVSDALHSKREAYQEVDLIDVALATARKQCDDSATRANRLSVTIDVLRNAVARFLTKVDNRTHETAPNNDKLPESFAQLDTKVTQMMKAVNAALIKDKDSRDSGPGMAPALDVSNINKVLYRSLMSAEPDTSLRNVRVAPRDNEDERKMKRKALLGVDYQSDDDKDPALSESDFDGAAAGGHQSLHQLDSPYSHSWEEPPFVDRTTVKKLSRLIMGKHEKNSHNEGHASGSVVGSSRVKPGVR